MSPPIEKAADEGRPSHELPENRAIAEKLREVAELLEVQDANPFRVRAWRHAAEVVRGLEVPALEHAEAGTLSELPGIGPSLSRAIAELARSGRLGLLEHLRGEAQPEQLFRTVPGIGPELAHRIHEELGIDSLEELELAAWDGRLARVEGLGERRVRAVRESLAGRFRRGLVASEVAHQRSPGESPPVADLLEVDRRYREAAERGELPRIAPRRFNPTGEAWLPILHTEVGGRHYTALYSNTARAHELGTTRDWVVIYRDDHEGDGQWTVVTARRGRLAGQRAVRGREDEQDW